MKTYPQNDTLEAPPRVGGLRLVSLLLRGAARRRAVAALRAGNLRVIARTDLLAPSRLPALARDSLSLLVAGGAFFAIVSIIAWYLHGVQA